MKIKNILVSQPIPAVPEKSPFHEIASKYNISIDFHPFIRVERVDVKEFRSQRVDILSHSAIIFTNRSSIDHFFQICEETRVSIPETMKYFCVTEAIALYLQKYIIYRKRKIFFGKAALADLMEQVVKHKNEKFLLPLPDPHKPDITAALDKLRIKYSKVIMSHTVPADISNVDLGSYDMVVLYSPFEIDTLSGRIVPEENIPVIAAFGNGTAVAAVDAGYSVSVLAPTPEAPSMVHAIDRFIVSINAGETPQAPSIKREVPDISHLKATKPSGKSKPKTAAKADAAKPKSA